MTKCNAIWNLYGYKVPVIASELTSTGQTNTSYFLLITSYLSKPQGQLEVRVAIRLASFGVILGLRQK